MTRSFTRHLRAVLKSNLQAWPVGCDKKALSEKAKGVWQVLPSTQRLLISKFNPFRSIRNRAILYLINQGLSHQIISEVSGLSIVTIRRISATQKRKKA